MENQNTQNNNNEEWIKIEPNMWKPEQDGDSITGVLISKEEANPAARMSAKYSLENEQGQFLVWGSTVLDGRMSYINIGDKVRITFRGRTQNAVGQDLKLFDVETTAKKS